MSAAISMDLIDELRGVVGSDAVLTGRSQLLVYECDGFTIEKNSQGRQRVQRPRRPLPAAWRGHESGRRVPAGGRRRHDRVDSHEADPGDQLAGPLRGG
jgi:hypothetical protein